jgi:hypothetical protein
MWSWTVFRLTHIRLYQQVHNFGEIIELGKENYNDIERQRHGGENIGKELICSLWKYEF